MAKRPSFQFYPSDWLRDTALRTCSEGARGIWMDMLCYMHEGCPYGHLKVNGKVILPPTLARMVGCDIGLLEGYLKELSDAGVVQTDSDGCFYSKRMVRDEKVREARAAGGKMGGNPALVGDKDSQEVNLKDNLSNESKDKQKPTPSSSSSSSPSGNTPYSPPKGEPEGFAEFWAIYPRKTGKGNARKAWKKIKPSQSLQTKIIESLEQQKLSSQWNKENGKYIPLPATWLNQERWDDDPGGVPQQRRGLVV